MHHVIMAPRIYENFSTKGAKSTSFLTAITTIKEPKQFEELHSVFERFCSEIFTEFIYLLRATTSTSGSSSKPKKCFEMLVKGVEWKTPNLKLVLAIVESLDPRRA